MRMLICIKNFTKYSPFIYNEIIYQSHINDVHVVCTDFNIDQQIPIDKVTQIVHNENNPFARAKQFLRIHDLNLNYRSGEVHRQMAELVERFKPDIVQCHFADEALFFLDNIDVIDVPIIIMFHGYDASTWLRNKTYINRYGKLLKQANIMPVTCSIDMRDRLAANGLNMRKCRVIYYGVDTDFFARVSYENNDIPVFSQVAAFRVKKGHEYTLKAFKEFKDKNPEQQFKLILAGDGSQRNRIMQMASELGLSDCTEFPGWVNGQQAKELLERSTAFVHHSVTGKDGDMEGIPNAIMEAMAMELPVIVSNHSGIPELVIDGVHGTVVEERNVPAYALAIGDTINKGFQGDNRKRILEQFELTKRNVQLANALRIASGLRA